MLKRYLVAYADGTWSPCYGISADNIRQTIEHDPSTTQQVKAVVIYPVEEKENV